MPSGGPLRERSGLKMKNAFSTYHPLVNFLYFGVVMIYSMVFLHPTLLFISLAGAFSWSVYLGGRKVLRRNLLILLPVMLLAALVNPAFNHEGTTILAYLPTGNPLTLESILYGVAAAAVLMAVLLWFTCFNKIMTSDKFVYLFGRLAPALSLVLSMALRFVPRFRTQAGNISGAQRCVGRDVSNGSVFQRMVHGLRILSILLTWSLENAIETADSMKSRGYGLPGRSAFSIYRLDGRDRAALWWIGGLGVCLLGAWAAGGTYFRYFPSIQGSGWTVWSVSAAVFYALLCATPLIIDRREDRKWRRLQSGI